MTELLCVKTHSQRAVIAGQWYQMISDKPPCGCDSFDVGLSAINTSGRQLSSPFTTCKGCHQTYKTDMIWWINKALFADLAFSFAEKESEKQSEPLPMVQEL